MRLYAGTSLDFISDSVHNRIAEKLKAGFFANYRREASPGEVGSRGIPCVPCLKCSTRVASMITE